MRVLWNIYDNYKDKMWGPYGPYDAFSLKDNWFDNSYLAIDQLPIVSMVENYRSGLLWSLFMNIPEVQEGLARMGVQPLPAANGFPNVVVPLKKTESGYEMDALDLRRHPDTGLYTIPYSCEKDGVVFFTLEDASGKVIKQFTREGRKGDNVLEFAQFMPVSPEPLQLIMHIADLTAGLPIRLN